MDMDIQESKQRKFQRRQVYKKKWQWQVDRMTATYCVKIIILFTD